MSEGADAMSSGNGRDDAETVDGGGDPRVGAGETRVDERALSAARAGRPLPSPVPSDEDLWNGLEQPFTMFGQFGVDWLDQRVFSQDTWWVDRLGRPYRLEEMSERYRRNVLAFLAESAVQRWLDEVRREALTAFTDAIRGKASFAVVARELGAPAVSDLDPVEWLESTPLVRRLRQLTPDASHNPD